LEHLLFKGTATRSAREIAAAVDRVGGDMNAFTAKEFTAYYCRVPARHLGLAVELLGDVLTAPALRDVDIESERQVILEELAMDEDAPDDTAYRLLGEAMFPGHPLGRETAGAAETVETITPDDVRRFFADHYRSGSMVVAVAGPVDHDEVVSAVETAFAAGSGGTAVVSRQAPGGEFHALAGEERDSEQAHLIVGLRALDRFDPDREALDVVTHVLGGGPSSRLFQTIREERGLTYSTYAALSVYGDAGALTAYAATNPENATEVMALLEHEVDLLVNGGITDDELEIAKGYLTGAYAMGFEGTGSRVDRLGGLLTSYGEIRSIPDQIARWESVTQADVARVIERVIAGPRARCVVGPLNPTALLGPA
jgi:predicted Zn-dependent peptidase